MFIINYNTLKKNFFFKSLRKKGMFSLKWNERNFGDDNEGQCCKNYYCVLTSWFDVKIVSVSDTTPIRYSHSSSCILSF